MAYLSNIRESYKFKGKTVEVLFGSSEWKQFIKNKDTTISVKDGMVPPGFQQRPDLISDVFFDTPNLWWLILLLNDISDPFEELTVGRKIKIPVNDI